MVAARVLETDVLSKAPMHSFRAELTGVYARGNLEVKEESLTNFKAFSYLAPLKFAGVVETNFQCHPNGNILMD